MVNKVIELLSWLQRCLDWTVIVGLFLLLIGLRHIRLDDSQFLLLAGVLIGFSVVAQLRGLYSSLKFNSFGVDTANLVTVWLTVCAITLMVLFALKESDTYSRLVVITWLLVSPMVMVLCRYLLLRFSFANGRRKIKIALFGNGATAQAFLTHLAHLNWPWLKVAGVYEDAPVDAANIADANDLDTAVSRLVADARRGHIDMVYLAMSSLDESRFETLLQALADTTVSVYLLPDVFLSDLMRSRWMKFGDYTVVSVYDTPFMGIYGWLKRATDLIIASIILCLIWPVMLIIAVAIKLTSSGPVLFKQRRYGLNGESINVYKFRSMTVMDNGDHVQQAQKHDPRITPLGRFLRRSSLDELPQFINVLQGRMSVVGPRPHANAHNEDYRKRIKGYMLRHKVKPGITGWAQVNGWRGETDTLEKMEKRVEYDLEYIQTWSVWLDLKIVLLTIQKGFFGKNAY